MIIHSIHLKKILAFFFVPSFIACNSPKNSVDNSVSSGTGNSGVVSSDTVKQKIDGKMMWRCYDANGTLHMNDELAEFFREWRADSSALSSEFRKIHCEPLNMKANILTGMRKTDIEKYMGKPNQHHESSDGSSTFSYNVESGCYNPEFDCCWLEIFFDKNGMVTETIESCT
ncbi:MAG TPA: hypothetical protein VL651_13275 [Bacteroidia bacterium]|jgi:hypothetical protein|nr:hypothetical protein [Bacteroidia bacterium]